MKLRAEVMILPAAGAPMNSMVKITVRVAAMALVLAAALSTTHFEFPAQASELTRDGPWVFTERIDENTGRHEHMAATPAAEDADIWLLLVCNHLEITASLMHGMAFPSAGHSPSKLILRSDRFPVVAVVAQAVQKNQLSIDAATTRHLMPLIVDSERMVISMSRNGGAARDYTFSLQPNGLALGGIVHGCLSRDE